MRSFVGVLTLALLLPALAGCEHGNCNKDTDCHVGEFCFGTCRKKGPDASVPMFVDATPIFDARPVIDAPPVIDANPTAQPVLVFNEVNPTLGTGDLIEIKVVTGGNLNGIRVVQNPVTSGSRVTFVTFGNHIVEPNDLILIHAPAGTVTTRVGLRWWRDGIDPWLPGVGDHGQHRRRD
jgi:hypothetical protein